MCAMKIKTEQEFLTNKRKEVGKKKKNSCKQATEVPPGEGEGRPFPLCHLINRVTYTRALSPWTEAAVRRLPTNKILRCPQWSSVLK